MIKHFSNPEADIFFANTKKWASELYRLRTIALDCGLVEEVKWKQPCYTFRNNNVVIIGKFKEYCAYLFFKGSLMDDAQNILIQPTENVQAGRQIRFTNETQINDLEPFLKTYLYEAIGIEEAGLKVEMKKPSDLVLVAELENALQKNKKLKSAFAALTPGRQRAYNLHFSGAKQSATRISRIENYTEKILNGIGLNDCTCGMSKRMPSCDGSHKYLVK